MNPDSMDVDGQTGVQLKSGAVSGDGSGGEGRREEGKTRLGGRAFKEQCSKAERQSGSIGRQENSDPSS